MHCDPCLGRGSFPESAGVSTPQKAFSGSWWGPEGPRISFNAKKHHFLSLSYGAPKDPGSSLNKEKAHCT